MEMIIDFPGGSRVDAHFRGFTFPTDQPPAATAPMPFDLFLASIGTCAGIYVLGFCQKRGLPTNGIQVVQHIQSNLATGMVEEIDIDIMVPATFPEKYHEALIRAAELCKVKKHLEQPPKFKIATVVAETHQLN